MENENKIYRKVYLKFLILKVRAKISYMAFLRNMTVIELFAHTILKSYKEIRKQQLIESGK